MERTIEPMYRRVMQRTVMVPCQVSSCGCKTATRTHSLYVSLVTVTIQIGDLRLNPLFATFLTSLI
jgi:hypothetical protein